MTYFLRRERDGAGDSGGMSMIFWKDDDGKLQTEQNARPKLGAGIRVGSLASRTYSDQDYWSTTPVTEILEDTPEKVKFKTRNSIYIWENN